MSMLDDIVFISALRQARRLMEQGHDAETAAETACPGAWRSYRPKVLERLLAEQKTAAREGVRQPERRTSAATGRRRRGKS